MLDLTATLILEGLQQIDLTVRLALLGADTAGASALPR
jgi:hypothetical protein